MFHSLIQNIVLDNEEMWPITKSIRDKIRTAELVEKMHKGHKNGKTNRGNLAESVFLTKTLENQALQWYGHRTVSLCIRRTSEERWSKRILQWYPKGKSGIERPALSGETHKKYYDRKDFQPEEWYVRQL